MMIVPKERFANLVLASKKLKVAPTQGQMNMTVPLMLRMEHVFPVRQGMKKILTDFVRFVPTDTLPTLQVLVMRMKTRKKRFLGSMSQELERP